MIKRLIINTIGQRRIENVAKRHNLPTWWVTSAIIEYLPCRRFLEKGSLWFFDFTKFDKNQVRSLIDKGVVIPEYFVVQNIRQEDFYERIHLAALMGSPVAEMEEKAIFPEGILNDTCFPALGNPIDVWDPKLNFHTHAVVSDGGSLYQWRVSELYQITESSSWFKSDLFNLLPLWEVYQKITQLNNPEILNSPTDEMRFRLEEYYNELERARSPLREKIWDFHLQKKNAIKNEKPGPSAIPRFTILDAFKYRDGEYRVYSPIEPLFYRAALRNCKLAISWHDEYLKTSIQNAMHKEIEYSLMTIISAVSCLEAYINTIIERYPTDPKYKKLKDHKKQWLLVSKVLNPSNPFEEDSPPFSNFSKLVDLRNDALHYPVRYGTPIGDLTPLYHSYGHQNAQLSIDVIDPMIERLSENSTIPLPRWLARFRTSSGYWDDAFS